MNNDVSETGLSLGGRERRDALRGEMIEAFVGLHRARRLQRRAGVSVALLAVAGITAWISAYQTSTSGGHATHRSGAVATALVEILEAPSSGNTIEFAYIEDGSFSVVSIIEGSTSLVETVDDAGLVETLAQMDRAAGLIQIGDTVRLTRDVVDEDVVDPSLERGSGIGHPLNRGNTRSSAGV